MALRTFSCQNQRQAFTLHGTSRNLRKCLSLTTIALKSHKRKRSLEITFSNLKPNKERAHNQKSFPVVLTMISTFCNFSSSFTRWRIPQRRRKVFIVDVNCNHGNVRAEELLLTSSGGESESGANRAQNANNIFVSQWKPVNFHLSVQRPQPPFRPLSRLRISALRSVYKKSLHFQEEETFG